MSDVPIPFYLRRNGDFHWDSQLAEARRKGPLRVPLVQGGEAWLVTALGDVQAVLSDTRRFRNMLPPEDLSRAMALGDGGLSDEDLARFRTGNLIALDAPDHTRLRRLLTPAFTHRRMQLLQPRIVQIVDETLDLLEEAGPPVDLVQTFALPVPSLVICELLGVPYEDRAAFQERARQLMDASLPPLERAQLLGRSVAYMASLVERVRSQPGPGLLSALVHEHHETVSVEEVIGIGHGLLLAGHETTANMIALSTYALLRNPDQLDLLRNHPEGIDAAVDELLRWLTVVTTSFTRIAVEEVAVAGTRIAAGELVIASLAAANRDPAIGECPEDLNLARPAAGSVAFGHGAHRCLGAPLAKQELGIALTALLQRFPRLRLRDEASSAQLRSELSFVQGPVSLHVSW